MNLNIKLIQESFGAIKPHATDVIEKFHQELLTRHPEVKVIFDEKRLFLQQRVFVNSLAHIVEYLEESDHLSDYLRKIGRKHFKYGRHPESFEWVGESLLATLEYYFDDQWTRELAQNWKTTLEFIVQEIKLGMESQIKIEPVEPEHPTHVPTSPNVPVSELALLAHQCVESLFKKTIDDYVQSASFQQAIREKAQELLRKALETESKQMLHELRDQKGISNHVA